MRNEVLFEKIEACAKLTAEIKAEGVLACEFIDEVHLSVECFKRLSKGHYTLIKARASDEYPYEVEFLHGGKRFFCILSRQEARDEEYGLFPRECGNTMRDSCLNPMS